MDQYAKIMIVDDSSFMRQVLKDILTAAGFVRFVEVDSGQECLERFSAEKPDIVLLDIIMPEMNGLEVLKTIGAKTKVVVISAVGQEKVIEEAKRRGALDYIVKPFDEKDVAAKITKVLGG